MPQNGFFRFYALSRRPPAQILNFAIYSFISAYYSYIKQYKFKKQKITKFRNASKLLFPISCFIQETPAQIFHFVIYSFISAYYSYIKQYKFKTKKLQKFKMAFFRFYALPRRPLLKFSILPFTHLFPLISSI